jgi:hypothetical protein
MYDTKIILDHPYVRGNNLTRGHVEIPVEEAIDLMEDHRITLQSTLQPAKGPLVLCSRDEARALNANFVPRHHNYSTWARMARTGMNFNKYESYLPSCVEYVSRKYGYVMSWCQLGCTWP